MKKTILLLSMIFAVVANISAQTITISASVDSVKYTTTGEIKASTDDNTRTAIFNVNLSGASTTETAAFQYDIKVPKGYKVDEASFGISNGNLIANSFSATRISGDNDYNGSVYRIIYNENSRTKNFNGEIGHFTVSVDKTLEGSNQVFSFNNVFLANCKYEENENDDGDIETVGTFTAITVSEATFTFTQPEPISATLDENSTESISDQLKKYKVSIGQEIDNLTIKRTVKAGNWGTIVLPVDLTEAEVKDAFGDNAVLADFTGFDADSMDTNNRYYKWYFYTSTHSGGMSANTPYFLKASKEVSSIELKNKTIKYLSEKVSETISQSKKINPNARDINSLVFAGYYIPHKMDEGDVFLSSNKFWFANTNTKELKGFRAYIQFVQQAGLKFDNINSSSVKFFTYLDKEPSDVTGIESVNIKNSVDDGKIYNLSGVYVGNELNVLPAGIYIRNGKKVIVSNN